MCCYAPGWLQPKICWRNGAVSDPDTEGLRGGGGGQCPTQGHATRPWPGDKYEIDTGRSGLIWQRWRQLIKYESMERRRYVIEERESARKGKIIREVAERQLIRVIE